MSEQKTGFLPDGYMPIPTAEQLADALENVRCFHDMSAELIAPELLANLLAVTTVKESLSVAPSLPAAGSAEEEVEVVAWRYRHSEQEKWQAGVERKSLWETEPLMTVAQHERIVAAFSAQQSAQPEFCCEHSYKVAKQAAWGDGWIPVNERLPSMVQEVIVYSEFDGVTAGILDSYGEWYSPNSDYKLTRVVAWQPLPAAPSLLATHRGQASGYHSEGDQNE